MSLKQKVIISAIVIIVVLNIVTFVSLRGTFIKDGQSQMDIKARVAIVIDDWGYNLNCIKVLRSIDVALTLSILPNLPYSSKIATIARSLDKQIIVHLPLEPETKGRGHIRLEKDTITVDMDEKTLVATLDASLKTVPFAQGVSNHMGSRATANKRVMSLIFDELKKREFFFLDNLVIGDSVCADLAYEKNLRFATRDIFLDNENDVAYIKNQLTQLKDKALVLGEAVGVGHARSTTLEVLKEEIPLMEKEGIKFVFISELME